MHPQVSAKSFRIAEDTKSGMTTGGGEGGDVYSAFLLLNSCSLSMVRRMESRKNWSALQAAAGDGERTVLTTEGGCVSSGSSSLSSSSSKNDDPSAVRGVVQGGQDMVMETIVLSGKDTPSHATKLGNFEQPVLGNAKRYHLANWRAN